MDFNISVTQMPLRKGGCPSSNQVISLLEIFALPHQIKHLTGDLDVGAVLRITIDHGPQVLTSDSVYFTGRIHLLQQETNCISPDFGDVQW
jgi:hypothetical protein